MTNQFSFIGILAAFLFYLNSFAGNIVNNGDFELGSISSTSGWTTIGTQNFSIESVNPLAGVYSAKIITGISTPGNIQSQGVSQFLNFPANSRYLVSFKAKASAACNIQGFVVQAFNPFGMLASSSNIYLTTSTQSFSYYVNSISLSGLCNFVFNYGNVATGTTIWLDDIVVQESQPLTSANLCNGDFENSMNNALCTPSGYNYNFRSTGTSTSNENQYFYGWTNLRLSTVSDTALICFDASVNKIAGAKSLKFTKVASGSQHTLTSQDLRFAWLFAGVRSKYYTISFKAKSSVNLNIGVAISNMVTNTNLVAVNYLKEQTLSLSPVVKTYICSTTTPINQTDNRCVLAFCLGMLPANASVWIDDVNLMEGESVSGLSLSTTKATVNMKSTVQLKATLSPIDAYIQAVNWSSSDSTIASVNAIGLVTGVSAGTAIITATALDGTKNASAQVTVTKLTDLIISPALIPITAVDLVNPGRGFFRWLGMEQATVPSTDNYRRVSWSEVEPSIGTYDFSVFDQEADLAKYDADGRGSLGLGIRCLVENTLRSYPSYLDAKMSSWLSTKKNSWVPDWNDAYFLERHDSLVAALGRKYNADPRIGYVEIRAFGNWGEWHMTGFGDPIAPMVTITPASINRLIDCYVKAFPDKQLIMLADSTGLKYALSKTGLKYPIGVRKDSWCYSQFENFGYDPTDRWKTAPIIVEPYGNNGNKKNDFSLALKQVVNCHVSAVANGNFVWADMSASAKDSLIFASKTAGYRPILRSVTYPARFIPGQSLRINATWSNLGVAPVYRDWNITYRLCDTITGLPVWETPSKLKMRNLLPTYNFATQQDVPVLFFDTLTVPSNIRAGNYAFEMLIADPTSYFPPLRLANMGRKASGAYDLGKVSISFPTEVRAIQASDDFNILSISKSELNINVLQAGVYGFSVFSMDGSCVYVSKDNVLDIGIHTIRINQLLNGIYALKFYNKNQQKVMRFILK